MRVTRLVKKLGRTINLGDFNSASFGDEIEVVLEEGENLDTAEEKLYKIVAGFLAKDINRMREGRKNGKKDKAK
ncbi:MAG: hypothetical protein E2O29_01550 [Deltaproteobacteria bacterium]|nr:MAG: hypothetical protein E2O29_01550 [Deltaproteobacteria bacterium]